MENDAGIFNQELYYTPSQPGQKIYIITIQFANQLDDRVARFILRIRKPSK
jgi:hypothetical protein